MAKKVDFMNGLGTCDERNDAMFQQHILRLMIVRKLIGICEGLTIEAALDILDGAKTTLINHTTIGDTSEYLCHIPSATWLDKNEVRLRGFNQTALEQETDTSHQ